MGEWDEELAELEHRRALAAQHGGAERVARQHASGRLTVRERIGLLLDEGSFREIGGLAGTARYDEHGGLISFIPANLVFGEGRLDGRRVVLAGDDFTVRGGAADAAIVEKQIAAERMARELRIPLIPPCPAHQRRIQPQSQ